MIRLYYSTSIIDFDFELNQCDINYLENSDATECIPCSGIGHFLNNKDKCICGEGAVLKNGVCECKNGFIEWEGFGKCRPECTGIMAEFNQETGQCYCPIDNTSLDGEDCLCDTNYQVNISVISY